MDAGEQRDSRKSRRASSSMSSRNAVILLSATTAVVLIVTVIGCAKMPYGYPGDMAKSKDKQEVFLRNNLERLVWVAMVDSGKTGSHRQLVVDAQTGKTTDENA